MITQRIAGLQALLTACQIVLALALFWVLALTLVSPRAPEGAGVETIYLGYSAVVLVALVLEALSGQPLRRTGFYHESLLNVHRASLRQTLHAAGLLLFFLVAEKDTLISRAFLFTFFPTLYLLLLVSGYSLPKALARWLYNGSRRERTLLIGRVAEAEALRPWLERRASLGLSTLGLVSDDPPWEFAHGGFPNLGQKERLADVIRSHRVTQVILTALPEDLSEHHAMIDVCERLGVRFLVVSNLQEHWGRPLSFIEDGGMRFIGMREEPLENPLNQMLKRAIDLAVALPVVCLVLPPVTLVVWLLQRWQAPGPVLFKQTRAGLQNREFQIVKYRTMRVVRPAPAVSPAVGNQPVAASPPVVVARSEEARQATVNDLRIYPAGRWLRKLSVDELPQFWNVLRGEMSLVGPRPHMVEHNAQFAECLANYHVRTFVKPGITGLAQVRGFRGEAKSSLDIARRVTADIEYLEKWHLSLDADILVRTIAHVVNPPRTAY